MAGEGRQAMAQNRPTGQRLVLLGQIAAETLAPAGGHNQANTGAQRLLRSKHHSPRGRLGARQGPAKALASVPVGGIANKLVSEERPP
jgi:hypothetical protein